MTEEEVIKCDVRLSRRAQKQILKLRRFIVEKLTTWVTNLEKDGLEEVRKIPGYHDEPLQGNRWGQRSIRLNEAYRAIYVQGSERSKKAVTILEVSKHEY